jgi:hypothetical protein
VSKWRSSQKGGCSREALIAFGALKRPARSRSSTSCDPACFHVGLPEGIHGAANRRLRHHRRLQIGGPGRVRRLDRLAMLAPFRFSGLLRRAARRAGEWPVADRSDRGSAGCETALPSRHARPRDRVSDRARSSRDCRFHAPGGRGESRADRHGPIGAGGFSHRVRRPVRLRRDGPLGQASL